MDYPFEKPGQSRQRKIDQGGDEVANRGFQRVGQARDYQPRQNRRAPQGAVPEGTVFEVVIDVEQERRARL